MNQKQIEQFSTAMLILAATNDMADSELREAVLKLKRQPTVTRQERALGELAYTSSDDVMRRMRRFLTEKGAWGQYVDYMDRRQEQMDYYLTVLRVSIKQAADDCGEENSRLLADVCLAGVLLDIAVKTYSQLVVALRRAHLDVTRVWRGMSLKEARKFYAGALRHSKIETSAKAVKALNESERVQSAAKIFSKALFSGDDMREAEEYAVSLKDESNETI